MVMIKVPLVVAVGKVKVIIQQILDGIIPSLLPLLGTLTCYVLLKKGRSAVIILLAIIVSAVFFKWLGILG